MVVDRDHCPTVKNRRCATLIGRIVRRPSLSPCFAIRRRASKHTGAIR